MGDDGKMKKLNDEYIATFKTLPAYHHCTRFRISGISGLKAISCGISGGKQMIKFPCASNCGRVFQCSQNETTLLVRASPSFTSLLFAVRTYTFASAYRKETGDFFCTGGFYHLVACLFETT